MIMIDQKKKKRITTRFYTSKIKSRTANPSLSNCDAILRIFPIAWLLPSVVNNCPI